MTATLCNPTFSEHAKRRTEEMGLRRKDVRRVLRDPEMTWRTARRGDDYIAYVRDGLTVITTTRHHIVTVLWHTQEQYKRRCATAVT